MPILFIAPLPPPVHGQAVVSAYLLARLRELGISCRAVNEGPAGRRGAHSICHRIRSLVLAAVLLFADSISGRSGPVYISVNANLGMFVTALLAALARITGHTLILHHHTAAHVDRPRLSMRLLAFSAGPVAIHLCQCLFMSTRLKTVYRHHQIKTKILSNVVTLPASPASPSRSEERRSLTIGHMSNLSFEKGIRESVNTLHEIRRRGFDARLLLAGPASSAAVQSFVDDSVRNSSHHIDYIGPVYNDAKESFFSGIDVFLFPTTYANETQGIVNLEALRHGVPVVAYARCCIAEDIDEKAGLAVPLTCSFAPTAADWILTHLIDPDARHNASMRAHERFSELHALAQSNLHDLLIQFTTTIT